MDYFAFVLLIYSASDKIYSSLTKYLVLVKNEVRQIKYYAVSTSFTRGNIIKKTIAS